MHANHVCGLWTFQTNLINYHIKSMNSIKLHHKPTQLFNIAYPSKFAWLTSTNINIISYSCNMRPASMFIVHSLQLIVNQMHQKSMELFNLELKPNEFVSIAPACKLTRIEGNRSMKLRLSCNPLLEFWMSHFLMTGAQSRVKFDDLGKNCSTWVASFGHQNCKSSLPRALMVAAQVPRGLRIRLLFSLNWFNCLLY